MKIKTIGIFGIALILMTMGAGTALANGEITVDIDIKPCSDPNSINLKSNGVVTVAILTTDTFDANEIDPETVRFGPASAAPLRWATEDVDENKDMDLVFKFKIQELGLTSVDTEATLTGELLDGQPFAGTDSVNPLQGE